MFARRHSLTGAPKRAVTIGSTVAALVVLSMSLVPASQATVSVTVRIENLAPADGTFLTPVWVGFHDGSFSVARIGDAASSGLERIAEDGNTGPLAQAFLDDGSGSVEATIVSGGQIPPFAPGQSTTMTFELNPLQPGRRFLSFASMVIPSNDAFVTGDPLRVFDDNGNFIGGTWLIEGSGVLDAGTEVNDEVPANTAFFGQAAPDTGTPENGTVQVHPGFMAPGGGGILDDPMFAAADFTAQGYQVLRVTVMAGVSVKIENLAPAGGGFLTPVWVGFHDGSFDVATPGEAAGPGLERLAEDGATGVLSQEFLGSGSGVVDGTIISDGDIPPIAPGGTAHMTFLLDPTADTSRYASFAPMVIPSNDAFVANLDPTARAVFDADGNFVGGSFLVLGASVYDAGTEVNDELPGNTAFFGQSSPDTGEDENGTVAMHTGLMPPESGGILDDPMFAAADFTAPGYVVARITLSYARGNAVNRLSFAQFAAGGGVSSEILLFNHEEQEVQAELTFKDDSGLALSFQLDGLPIDGEASVTVPAGGLRLLRGAADGPVAEGHVIVVADAPLKGAIVFGGSAGLAGVPNSPVTDNGFTVPILSYSDPGIDTGMAVANLADSELVLTLQLFSSEGELLATAMITIPAMGHLAGFAKEFDWDAPVDFSDFEGKLKASAESGGKFSAVGIQVRPSQFATLPVIVF